MNEYGGVSDFDDFPIHQPSIVQQAAAQTGTADPKAVAATSKVPSDLHVLPPTAVAWCVEALRNGAIDKGYGVRNWRDQVRPGIEMTTYLDAIGRHLMQIQEGEDFASDSHILHLAHVMAGCAILIDARACGTLIDNRVRGDVGAFESTQEAIRESRRLRAA
ncbi:dATP/dGTP diphosphohydrolase domain-containing protein [Aureimonas glaciei]|uniref:dATP/dGTP diphosphohydrolase domain-containing protein n=1 Tax=Aureimonas glaciei TaxID=1776957 RepID=UPI0016634733|nr:dATP/dGTP diphosphohydrolase domain-containing protein [Aureimonas glaciei]